MPDDDYKFVEKKCSRGCGKITWDSMTGSYNETCDDGKKCDSNGEVYVNGVLQSK